MCRSIKQLRRPEQAPTDEEIEAAARQFVRKISGYRVPSRTNQAAFEQAVGEIAASTRALLDQLTQTGDSDRRLYIEEHKLSPELPAQSK